MMSQSDSQGSAEKPQPAGASGRATATRRQLRPRSAQRPLVDEHPELDALLGREEEGGRAGTPRQLDVPLLCAKVERDAPAASFAAATPADEVTATALAAAGLRRPLLVRGDDKGGTAAACSALGLRLPPAQQLTPAGLAEQLGADLEVPTIDVPTQGSGPRATLAQLAEYLAQREAAWQQAQRGGKAPPAKRRRQQAQQAQQGALAGRMLNVVSLPLAGTILEGAISPPAAVEELELVGAAWPGEDVEEQRPETLLYALMGPAGVYTDWHVDMGGSAVWYHVVSGRKVFLAAPPTPENLQAFEEWSSSGKQASSWLGDKLSGLVRLSVGAGDTLLLPSAWPHAVSTPEPSFAVGGNFLHALDFGAIAECYRREQRLGVTPKFQFPLFRRLMWYAAEHALHRLRPCVRQGLHPGAAGMTRWELGGLPALVDLLGEWWRQQAQGGSRKAAGVPARIAEPWELLEELQDCLDTLHRRQQDQQHPPQAHPPGRQQGQREQAQQQQQAQQQDEQAQQPLEQQQQREKAQQQEQQQQQQQHEEQAQQPQEQHLQLAGGTGEADPAADGAASDFAVWAAMAVVGGMGASDADADAAGLDAAAGMTTAWAGGMGSPAGLGSPAQALRQSPPEEVLQMMPLEEAGGGGGGSGDMGLSLFFEQPSKPPQKQQQQQQHVQQVQGRGGQPKQQGGPLVIPKRAQPEAKAQQVKQSGTHGTASLASNGRQAGKRTARFTPRPRRVARSDSSSGGEPGSPSGSDESEGESLEDEQPSSEEEEDWMAGKPKGAAGSKQGQRQQQQQQPARRRLRKAGSDNAGATSAAAPEAKRRRTSAKAARGTAGSVAEGPAGSADGAGAAQGRAGSKAAPAAAAVPPVPPPPADLQALGRKHTPGYTISLSRRRSNLQQQSGSDARQPKQAATQHAQPEVPAAAAEGQGQLQHQDSGSAGAAGRPAWRRAAASAAAGEETANQAATAPGQPSVQEREAAEKLLAELQQLQAVVRREEELLARVQAGLVSLPDGGTKLSASLQQRREALKAKTDAAEGRCLTYLDDAGAVQGPFSAPQLQKLLRAGVLEEAARVRHPEKGEMSLAEALSLPEPLSAQLLRQREQAAQAAQAAQPLRGGLGGGVPHQQGGPRGPWRPRGRRSWEEERRRREWEEEQRRMDAETQAMAAAAEQEESGMWCFRDARSGRREMEGPYTVAELRDLHRRGTITDNILVHDEEQGVSVHLFTLLGYTDLAEVSRRQRAEAAARTREREAEQAQRLAAAAPAADAAHAAAGQGRAAGPGAEAPSGQGEGWGSGHHGGSSGGEPSPYQPSPAADIEGTPYEPSPVYSPPAAPQHAESGAELYSPSRADWDDEEEAAPEGQPPAAGPGPAGSEPAQAGDEAPPPPPPPPPPLAKPSAVVANDMEIDNAPTAAAAAAVAAPQAPLPRPVPMADALHAPPSAPGPASAPNLPEVSGRKASGRTAAPPWVQPSASPATGGAAAPGLPGAAAAAAGGAWAPPQPLAAQQQAAAAPGAVPVHAPEQQPLKQQLPQPAAQLSLAPQWAGGAGSLLQAPTAQQAQQPLIQSQLLLAQQLQLLLSQQQAQAQQQQQQQQQLMGPAQALHQQWPQQQQPGAFQQPVQPQFPAGQAFQHQVGFQSQASLQTGYGQQQPMQPLPQPQQLAPASAAGVPSGEQQQRQAYLQRLQQQEQAGAAAGAAEMEGALFFGGAQRAQRAQQGQQPGGQWQGPPQQPGASEQRWTQQQQPQLWQPGRGGGRGGRWQQGGGRQGGGRQGGGRQQRW